MSKKGVNSVVIIGNLGQDPETRYTNSGAAVTNISVATSESWKDKNTGQQQEKTEWHRIVFFGRLGEIAGEYLRKGSKVYVSGSLRTRKWQDQQGNDRYTTEIVGDELQMLDSKSSAAQNQHQDAGPPMPQPSPQNHGGKSAADYKPVNNFDDFDDDIPFN